MISILKNTKLYNEFLYHYDCHITQKEFYKLYGKELKKFKNIHKGKRCFVIGNGPSLLPTDLDKLKNEFTFCSNNIYKIYDQTDFRPTYYCNSDANVLKRIVNESPTRLNDIQAQFHFFQYDSRFVVDSYPDNSICYYFRIARNYNKAPKFARNIAKEIYNSSTVTYVMIQIAAYMGFSEIYLLGVDNNYSITMDNSGKITKHDNAVDHFYGDGTLASTNSAASVQRMTMGFESAKKYAEKHKITILNATRGGKLEVFQRIDFDKLF